jgi:excisionase family DNA binding protein
MALTIAINIDEQEIKRFLKEALMELLSEGFPAQQQQPEIFDVRQAANFLKMKLATLYEKTSEKLIPHFKKGKRLYFKKEELQDWINAGKVSTKEELESRAMTILMGKKDRRNY